MGRVRRRWSFDRRAASFASMTNLRSRTSRPETAMPLTLTSSAFEPNGPIPPDRDVRGRRRLAAAGVVRPAARDQEPRADRRRPRCAGTGRAAATWVHWVSTTPPTPARWPRAGDPCRPARAKVPTNGSAPATAVPAADWKAPLLPQAVRARRGAARPRRPPSRSSRRRLPAMFWARPNWWVRTTAAEPAPRWRRIWPTLSSAAIARAVTNAFDCND